MLQTILPATNSAERLGSRLGVGIAGRVDLAVDVGRKFRRLGPSVLRSFRC